MIENSPFIMTVIVHHLYLHVKYACAVSPLFLEAGQALTLQYCNVLPMYNKSPCY